MNCAGCNAMTSDCVCLLDGLEKADLQEDRGLECELIRDYKECEKTNCGSNIKQECIKKDNVNSDNCFWTVE